jgi:hypothetical protein
MPKKYRNKTAVASYLSILIAIASFGVQYAYEGWGAKGVVPMLSPLGTGSLLIFGIAVILFIWNLRREELGHEQWQIVVAMRQSPLDKLEAALDRFKNETNALARQESLYDLSLYGFDGDTASELYKIVAHNEHYANLRNHDETVNQLKSEIEMLINTIGDKKKLRKLIHSLYRRENVAHAYVIFCELYTRHYKPDPMLNKAIQNRQSVPLFEEAFKYTYDWIKILRKGTDLD